MSNSESNKQSVAVTDDRRPQDRTSESNDPTEALGKPAGPRWQRVLFGSATWVFALSVYVPFVQIFPDYKLDWLLVFQLVFTRPLRLGSDVAFTYGPWGFAWSGYYPETFHWTLLVWTVIGTVAWLALWRVARSSLRPLWAQTIAVILALVAVGGEHSSYADSRLLFLGMLLLLYHFFVESKPRDGVKLLLITAVAIAGAIKFTYVLTGVVAVGAITFDELRRKRIPIGLFVFPVVYLVAWVAAGQHLSDLPKYASASMQGVASFDEAMSFNSPSEATDVLLFAVVAIPFLFTVAVVMVRRSPWGGPIIAIVFSAIMLVGFRAGYVRHDEHEIIATACLLSATVFCFILLFPTAGKTLRGAVLYSLIGAIALVSRSQLTYTGTTFPKRIFDQIQLAGREIAEIRHLLSLDQTETATQYRAGMKSIAGQVPIPPVEGRVDLVPLDLGTLFANGKTDQFFPRPTLQSYKAYNASLASRNAAFYASEEGPQTVFYNTDMIDGRYFGLDDSLMRLELFTRFNLETQVGNYLVFKRAPRPGSWRLRPITKIKIAPGQVYTLPDTGGSPIWAVTRFKSKPSGKLLASVYKPPMTFINVQSESGSDFTARFSTNAGETGFILSPVIVRKVDVKALIDGNFERLQNTKIHKFVFTHSAIYPTDWYYNAEVEIDLYHLDLTPPKIAELDS